MKVASFFAGCGGLDFGFENAGVRVIWANEFDPAIFSTYKLNHPNTYLCTKDIRLINKSDIPECDGFIGAPPCQAWSEAGSGLGFLDERGEVFLQYIRLIKEIKPNFFLIENVKGILDTRHEKAFSLITSTLEDVGYNLNIKLIDVADFGVPQNRERLFIVGIRNDLEINYVFPNPTISIKSTLFDAISDITEPPTEWKEREFINNNSNHNFYNGPFSYRFMARNRVRSWDELSFTIPASMYNIPLHPQAPKMTYVNSHKREFKKGFELLYRRLSVKECARIQSFPDNFYFDYKYIEDGYKMVGNAVPPKIGEILAKSIISCFNIKNQTKVLIGYVKSLQHLSLIKSNLVYYIRRGNRIGAMNFDNDIEIPDYLFLHGTKENHLFSIKKVPITRVNAKDLKAYNFNPQGQEYWLFTLEKEIINCNILSRLLDNINDFNKSPKIISL